MPVQIKKKGRSIVVRLPIGEALALQVHRPLAVPFSIGSAVREAAWGMINIHAKDKLEGMKVAIVSSVIEGDEVIVTFSSENDAVISLEEATK